MARRIAFALIAATAMGCILLTTGCSAGLTTGLREKIALEDPDPPILPVNPSVTIAFSLTRALEVSWAPATDAVIAQAELEYLLVYSTSAQSVTGEAALTEATVAQDWTANVTQGVVSGLTFDTTYYVNVVVRDRADNKAYYTPAQGKTANDLEAPVPGGSLATTSVGMETIALSWAAASDPDDLTAQSSLEYKVVYSDTAAIDTPEDAEANGAVGMDWTANVTSRTVSGLVDDRDYDVNVLVRDSVHNVAAYGTISVTTQKHPRIFFTETASPDQRVVRAEISGLSPLDLVTTGFGTVSNPAAIAVDPVERKVYFVDSDSVDGISEDGVIRRCDFDGQNVEDLITQNLPDPYGIALDYSAPNRYLYWTDVTNSAIYRSALPPPTADAANYVILDSDDGVGQPLGIEVDVLTGDFYWVQWAGDAFVMKAGASDPAGNITLLVWAGLSLPWDIAVDSENEILYWTDIGSKKVQSRLFSNALNSFTDLVTSNLASPCGISVDLASGDVFWVDADTSQAYRRAMTAGSSDATDFILMVGLQTPRGIQLY
jgi:hypothetical protein